MKDNIFENAYFGKQYKTRDGRKAIYHLVDIKGAHLLGIENCYGYFQYTDDGIYYHNNSTIDIVSEWVEETVPSFNECAKMWDLCDEYHCRKMLEGWTWKEAVQFIQEHWNDYEFNIDYSKELENNDE